MKKLFFLLFTSLISGILLAQEQKKKLDVDFDVNERVIYREIGIGLGGQSLRDLATSPLIYEGIGLNIKLGRWKADFQKESQFAFNTLIGATNIAIANETSTSIIGAFALNYSRLYQLKKLSSPKWNLKVGGMIDALLITRFNAALRNNSTGIDFFPTLFASAKITKTFARHPFLRKKRAPKKQQLSVRLDLGFINNTYRNGYAYTVHAPFYNSFDISEDYEFHFFSGFRAFTAIDYIVYSNNNKNAFKLSFNWEGARSGPTPDRFTWSYTIFQYTLLHRLN